MTHQASDISQWKFDDVRFNELNNRLSVNDNSYVDIKKAASNQDEHSMSKKDVLFEEDIRDKFFDDAKYLCTTPILAPSYDSCNLSIFEDQFDDSEIVDPFKDPVNEVTIITTTIENNTTDSTSSEIISVNNQTRILEDLIREIKQTLEKLCLEKIDNSIEHREIFVERQPPSNLRPRYKSDGTRQIEKSRTEPMIINLPDLRNIELEDDTRFYLRLSLIIHNENPSFQPYLHFNRLEYHSDDVEEMKDETVSVLLTPDDIQKRQKSLSRLSIVKTKLSSYKSELTPYVLTEIDKTFHSNITNSENLTVKQAKQFLKQLNMKMSKIACQLLIKQNERFHYTNITCETDVIYEKDQTNKRSAITDDSDEEYEHTPKSKSVKRKKNFHS